MRRAYIIGKGPSLDKLRREHVPPGSWVYPINDAIHKVLDIGLHDDCWIGGCQMDYELGEMKLPELQCLTMFLSYRIQDTELYRTYKNRFYYTPKNPSCVTATMAIEVAKTLVQPPDRIYLCCFDALVTGNLEYAKCIGYSSSRPHTSESTVPLNPKRFLGQRKEIIEAIGTTPFGWLTPGD